MVSVIVPVRNEERVISRLLRALLKLDYPPEKMEIVIVEDGSVDKTVGICTEYARQYPGQVKLFHQSESNGKPSALNCGLKHVRGKIVAVFDADNIPEPDNLLRAARYFEDSLVAAVQGRLIAVNEDENMLTKFASQEEDLRYEAYMRGKDVLGLFVPLTGSCYFVRRTVLDEVGGWNGTVLSEDTELAARLTKKGYKIRYASDVKSWQEYTATISGFFKQRTRWFRGTMEVSLRYGSLLKRPSKESLDAEVTLAGPFVIISCLVGYFVALLSFVVPLKPDFVSLFLANATSLLTVVLLALAGIAMAYNTKPRRLRNFLWFPFIYLYWFIQNFVASYAFLQILLRKPRKWEKTAKNGVIANSTFITEMEQIDT